mmetsp:Transcript_71791/g.162919  ORF Transcript_71791/g.162919 Transcript_71791/m.162919 type:complete len:258 (-) Transcript_71791:26-799(-)
MPHLLIERLRSCPTLLTMAVPKVKDSCLCTYVIEVLDILAAVIFVAGSVCFLPKYSVSLQHFFLGCILYIVGSFLYCLICVFTFSEALAWKGVTAFEVWENGLYLVGSVLFLAGSVLYLPPEGQLKYRNNAVMSLGQICETFSFLDSQFRGTVLFILGSVLFVFAAFTNLLNQQKQDEWSSRMLSAVTSLYMGGSLLFALGSIAFLPHLGCGEAMVTLGAWLFIVGSIMFLLGSLLSMCRTVKVLQSPSREGDLLLR